MPPKKLSAKLQPASFRGVPFQVEDTDLTAGRRTQVHEYPQRDKPYAEDLGRATRDLNFVGFLVGDDYVEQANRLLGALETAGPGTLVHPWLGSMQVSLVDKARVTFDAGLGRARVSMQFVEAGELVFPLASESTGAATRLAADKLSAASLASFAEKFGVKGFQDFVAAAANGTLMDKLGFVSTSEINKVLNFSNGLAKTFSTLSGLISNPKTFGAKLMGIFGLSGLTTSAIAWKRVANSFARVGKSTALQDKPASIITTPSRVQVQTNATALNALVRQSVLVQAVGATSLVGTPAVLAAIDQEMLVCSDAVYVALQDARAAVYTDMTTRARDSSRLKHVTPLRVQPALVMAYAEYGDASRDAEIVTRNNIRHPGFLPVKPIALLTQ
jgi:prophage DNA circulation protein